MLAVLSQTILDRSFSSTNIPVVRCKYPITVPGVARWLTVNEYNVSVNAEAGLNTSITSCVE